jgi:transcriptional regulator PpsR
MHDFRRKGLSYSFTSPTAWLENLAPDVAGRLITGASDVALVLNDEGSIEDVALSSDDLAEEGLQNWRGMAWIDTVTIESRPKVNALLAAASGDGVPQAMEINHPRLKGADIPIRYTVVGTGKRGKIIALGRDLRGISSLQQRLVEAQQTMESEYARLRGAETRYRMLFHLASEPVFVVDAQSLVIVEANPAAQKHVSAGQKLNNQPMASAVQAADVPALKTLLLQARTGGQSQSVQLRTSADQPFMVSASLFRQDKSAYLLVRMSPEFLAADAPPTTSRLGPIQDMFEQMPDGFVIIDQSLTILDANTAFLDMIQQASKAQAVGQPLDRWLGRPGIDLPLLMNNLAEHGAVRNFSTVLRGEYGGTEDVEITTGPAVTSDQTVYGFIVRSAAVRTAVSGHSDRALPRSVEHLTELVGRVPLKDLVRGSTDVIEKLCIEAALELSKDNRASAANMLGLSRQSFYAKMRRHGLGDLGDSE